MPRLLRAMFVYVLPLVAPWLVVLLVNAAPPPIPFARRGLPDERFEPDRCTWHCHNHGCRHQPVLPAVLTSDRALFGQTIEALYALGAHLSRSRSEGYGAANILVFCLGWPGLMYGLWVLAWAQRAELRRLRREGGA